MKPKEYDYDEEDDSEEEEENPRAAAARKMLDTDFPVAEMTDPDNIENYVRKSRYEEGE